MDTSSMISDLQRLLRTYLESDSRKSIVLLSRRTGVSQNTLRRLLQGDQNPTTDSVMKVLPVICGKLSAQLEFLRQHLPHIAEVVEANYSAMVRPEPNPDGFAEYVLDEKYNWLFNCAANLHGISETEVVEMRGSYGLDALRDLEDAELLTKGEDGRYRFSHCNWVLEGSDQTLKQMGLSLRQFQPKALGSDGAGLAHLTGCVKREVLGDIKKAYLEFVQKVSALKNDPDNEGDVPFFLDIAYSVYRAADVETK